MSTAFFPWALTLLDKMRRSLSLRTLFLIARWAWSSKLRFLPPAPSPRGDLAQTRTSRSQQEAKHCIDDLCWLSMRKLEQRRLVRHESKCPISPNRTCSDLPAARQQAQHLCCSQPWGRLGQHARCEQRHLSCLGRAGHKQSDCKSPRPEPSRILSHRRKEGD